MEKTLKQGCPSILERPRKFPGAGSGRCKCVEESAWNWEDSKQDLFLFLFVFFKIVFIYLGHLACPDGPRRAWTWPLPAPLQLLSASRTAVLPTGPLVPQVDTHFPLVCTLQPMACQECCLASFLMGPERGGQSHPRKEGPQVSETEAETQRERDREREQWKQWERAKTEPESLRPPCPALLRGNQLRGWRVLRAHQGFS